MQGAREKQLQDLRDKIAALETGPVLKEAAQNVTGTTANPLQIPIGALSEVFANHKQDSATAFGFSLALVYHLLNGIRHLAWDAGMGFEIPEFYASGWTVAVLTVVFTLAIWFFVLGAGA